MPQEQTSMQSLLASRVPFDIWPEQIFVSEPVSDATVQDRTLPLAVSFTGDWEIIPGIRVTGISVDYIAQDNAYDLIVISDLLLFKGTANEVKLELFGECQSQTEDNTTSLRFGAKTDPKTKIHFGDLVDEVLKDTGLGLQLPAALHNLEVSNLDVELSIVQQNTGNQGTDNGDEQDPSSRLLSIGFTIGSSAGDWEIIPGFLSLQPARIDLTLGNGAVQVEIQDSLTVLGVNWLMDVQLPSLHGSLEMAGDGYALNNLLDHFHLPAAGMENARLSAASMIFDAQSRIAMLHLELQDPWEMGHFEVKDVQFELDYQGGQEGGFAAQFSAAIDITRDDNAPIELQLSAEHMGPGLGWQVAGSLTTEDDPLTVADVAKAFGMGGQISGLGDLQNIGLVSVGVRYDTHASRLSADCTIHLSHSAQLLLSLDRHPVNEEKSNDVPSYEVRFSGKITVNDLEFDLLFAKDGSGERLVGVYIDNGGGTQVIDGLIKALSDGSVDGLQMASPSA